jgi:hypothetical protein
MSRRRDRERREVKPRRPALGAVEQRGDLLVGELDSAGTEQVLRLSGVEREQFGADLE